MREGGRVIPVKDRRCMSPIYHFIEKAVSEKGTRAVLADLQTDSPLRRGLTKIREYYHIEGTPLSPIGQGLRRIATSLPAVKAAVVIEGTIQKLEKTPVGKAENRRKKRRLPHVEEIARTAVLLTCGVFGAETSSGGSSGYDEAYRDAMEDPYIDEYPPFTPDVQQRAQDLIDSMNKRGQDTTYMQKEVDRLRREYEEGQN